MKLRHLLFGLLAGVAFVACTNDDDPASVSPVNGGNEVAATRSYISVNFVMPGNATTRAGETFEAGLDKENKVSNGVLFFFDGKTQVADPFEISGDSDWTKETPSEGNKYIEKKSPIIVVLENPIKKPTSVVAILNLGDKATLANLEKPITRSTSLDELKAIVADYATDKQSEGKFVMSSSAYDGAEEDVAAKIDKTYETYDAAKTGPAIEVPVERVVAKVEVKENEDGVTQNLPKVTIEGKEVQVVAEVKGWWLDNAASQSLLLKNIDGFAETAPFAGWNDATNMRSYWAKPVTGTLKHGKYSKDNAAKYVQENVDPQNPTKVVVAATLTANGKALELVKFKGKLYTIEDFEKEVVAILASTFYTKTTGDDGTITYASVNKDNVTITYDTKVEGAQYKAKVKLAYKKGAANVVLVKKTGPGTYGNPIDDFDADNSYDVQYWKDGQTYYYVPIEHVAQNGNNLAVPGVVRNHVYKLTINSITGLGTPVPFTDEEIIPTTPETEKETYISCQIEILAWKVVEQGVQLGAE